VYYVEAYSERLAMSRFVTYYNEALTNNSSSSKISIEDLSIVVPNYKTRIKIWDKNEPSYNVCLVVEATDEDPRDKFIDDLPWLLRSLRLQSRDLTRLFPDWKSAYAEIANKVDEYRCADVIVDVIDNKAHYEKLTAADLLDEIGMLYDF
jgi:hypothetical protein